MYHVRYQGKSIMDSKRDLSSNEEMEILLCGPSFGSKSALLLLDIQEFK